jgi:hypothetical protein
MNDLATKAVLVTMETRMNDGDNPMEMKVMVAVTMSSCC